MSDLQQRKYYKLFTGTNQSEGYDKIHLGYEADTTEIVLKKDKATFFHMPYFAETQTLADSSLIADGALPGPIPALADRIYKKQGNYGDATPWGNATGIKDGQWLCSWLYAVSSESPQWLDRYYDPGRLAYKEALEGNANFTDYYKHDPVYYDVPSTLTLEAGVLYQYFHHGEQTAKEQVQTFSGPDKSRLRLNIEDWSCACPDNPKPVDASIYNNTVTIENFTLDWVVSLFDPGYQDRNSLSFDNTNFINCYVTYDNSYTLKNEFTTSFWLNSKDITQATSTQLVGNLRRGGYGIFFDNLQHTPYYVIPENTYGHFFYFNSEGNVYLEKNTQLILGTPANYSFVSMNSNHETIGIEVNSSRGVKYNHVGDVITYTRDVNGGLLPLNGTPQFFVLSGNDDSIFVTSLSTYIFDKDLILKTALPQPYGYKEYLTFDTAGNLVRELSSLDVKFDSYNQKWVIKDTGVLTCQGIALTGLPTNTGTLSGTNTNLAVDPENNLWVLGDSNTAYKINTLTKQIIGTYEIGVQTTDTKPKNINFIRVYTRATNSYTWYAIIYHDFEQTVYQVTLDGKIVENTFLPPKLNILDPVTALQDPNQLTFISKGDFTGYERRRIFNKLLYNNNPQIQFKIASEYPNRSLPNSINTLSVPAQYLTNNVWHLITVTLKNSIAKIYIDNYERDSMILPGNARLTYDFKNDLFIGTPCGKTENYNREINSTSTIWNGYIDSIKVYDYAIEPKFIQYFTREKTNASDIEWNIQTAALQYVEVIERFFKHKLPGSKSVFFNIRLTGSKITDPSLRIRIENDIKLAVQQIKPAYSELLKVEWID